MTFYDTRGTEIKVGSTIVYAVKESTRVYMHEATVKEIYNRHEKKLAVIRAHDKKLVWLKNVNTVVVVPQRVMVPEGAAVAQVSIQDGVTRVEQTHIIRDSITKLRQGIMEETLVKHVFPWIAGLATEAYTRLPR